MTKGICWRYCAVVVFVGLLAMVSLPAAAQVRANASYTVCTDAPWAPFQMIAGTQIYGFDIDILRAVAAIQGFDINVKDMVFDAIIPSLRHGDCDIGASSFSINSKRQRLVDFSEPYHVANLAIVTRGDSNEDTLHVLTGTARVSLIGATRGSTGARWIKTQLVGQGYAVDRRVYKGYASAIAALAAGKLDAVIEDVAAARESVDAYSGKLVLSGVINTHDYYGFPVPPSDPNNLLPRINKGMAQLGLSVVTTTTGRQLYVQPDTPWAHLADVYFNSNGQTIAAAWKQCGHGILGADSVGDVRDYARCMVDASRELRAAVSRQPGQS